jgi:hypothetical protein
MGKLDLWNKTELENPQAFPLEKFFAPAHVNEQIETAENLPGLIGRQLVPHLFSIKLLLNSLAQQEQRHYLPGTPYMLDVKEQMRALAELRAPLANQGYLCDMSASKKPGSYERRLTSANREHGRIVAETELLTNRINKQPVVTIGQKRRVPQAEGSLNFVANIKFTANQLIYKTGPDYQSGATFLVIPRGVNPLEAFDQQQATRSVTYETAGIYEDQELVRLLVTSENRHSLSAWYYLGNIGGRSKINGVEGALFLKEPVELTELRNRGQIEDLEFIDPEKLNSGAGEP